MPHAPDVLQCRRFGFRRHHRRVEPRLAGFRSLVAVTRTLPCRFCFRGPPRDQPTGWLFARGCLLRSGGRATRARTCRIRRRSPPHVAAPAAPRSPAPRSRVFRWRRARSGGVDCGECSAGMRAAGAPAPRTRARGKAATTAERLWQHVGGAGGAQSALGAGTSAQHEASWLTSGRSEAVVSVPIPPWTLSADAAVADAGCEGGARGAAGVVAEPQLPPAANAAPASSEHLSVARRQTLTFERVRVRRPPPATAPTARCSWQAALLRALPSVSMRTPTRRARSRWSSSLHRPAGRRAAALQAAPAAHQRRRGHCCTALPESLHQVSCAPSSAARALARARWCATNAPQPAPVFRLPRIQAGACRCA